MNNFSETPLEKIFRLSPLQKKALSKMQLKTAAHLLYHFPQRYGEAGAVRSVEFLTAGETAVVFGQLKNLKTAKTWKSRVAISEGLLEDATGKIKIVWFNQPYLAKMFAEGDLTRIEGRVSKKRDGTLYFSNPKTDKVAKIPEGTSESLFLDETQENLAPIYPESRGLSSNWIFYSLQKICKSGILDKLNDPIPEQILKKYNLPSLRTALIWIHFPKKRADAEIARKRFAFEEIFFIQLDRQKEKMLAERAKAFVISKSKREIGEFVSTFPFPLTSAQERSVSAILEDLSRGQPMSRLLEGDVGSGKTAVAAVAAYAVVTTQPFDSAQGRLQTGNLQTAYMAPTEILAEQHFQSFIEYFAKYKIPVGLITGSGAKKFPSKTNKEKWTKISKSQLLKWVGNGEIPILIGTHALIQKSVKFKNLALVIVDEQHRFGVRQRMQLRRKHDIAPHLLSMTATPIPRTLALTLFGDLDLSLLDELPVGRQLPETKIVLPHERDAVYEKVREELKAGRQAFVICPRINDPDPDKENVLNAKSVRSEAERLQNKIFPEFRVAAITGKMKPAEKEKVMLDFKNRKSDILVATSVVEVGVNVPNATVILIENAERFGLAQLHQLRGRVLRSSHKPYCFVFADTKSSKTIARLRSFVGAKNGFELAEADLQQRGAGDLYGVKQWGVSDLAMEALKNLKMVEAAREEARSLIQKDFELKKYPLLVARISEKEKVHME